MFLATPVYLTERPKTRKSAKCLPTDIPETQSSKIYDRLLGFGQSSGNARKSVIDTSVVDAGVELDDYGAAPDGLEEVRRRLHRAAAAAGLVRAAGAHRSSWWARRNYEGSVGLGAGPKVQLLLV